MCGQNDELVALYGDQAALLLKARLADLRAAETLQDVIAGQLYEQPPGFFTFELGMGFRIVFKVINSSCVKLPSGLSDYSSVDRIFVIGIEHGSGT